MADDQDLFDFGAELQKATTGCRLDVKAFTTNRKLSPVQRQKMADAFSAEHNSVSGGREIISRKLPAVKDLFSAIRGAKAIWAAYTVKWDDGIRLIQTSRIDWMVEQIAACQAEAVKAAEALKANWDEVKQDAKKRLAELYVEDDYNFDVSNCFALHLSFPAIEPDRRLENLHPELFKAEQAKIAAQFEQAALVAEAGLKEQFAEMLAGIADKLESAKNDDGKRKHLQQRAVDALVEFADRFKAVSVGSSAEIEALVEQAKSLAQNKDLKALKKDASAKADFAKQLNAVKDALAKEIADAPARKIDW